MRKRNSEYSNRTVNIVLVVLISLSLLLSSCGEVAPRNPGSKIKAVATTSHIADLLKNVAGDKVEISTVMKVGSNHHTFEPTTSDAKLLATAEIIFSNGAGLEYWLDDLIRSVGATAPKVTTSVGVRLQDLDHGTHIHPLGDPHIWHSTENVKKMVANIAFGLAQFDPVNKAFYETNAKAYTVELDKLTQEIKILIDQIPPQRRKLVTSHEAFGYFADQFGLTVVGTVIYASDKAEPTSQQITALIDKIKTEQVPAIFTETTINPRLAEQIAKEAGVKVIPNLYSDSLGAAGSEADTYLKMMLVNAKTFSEGLK